MQQDLIRKAVVFGIRRDMILEDLLLRGHRVNGCRLISGPFAAGLSSDDPLSYAYDQSIQPRGYLPRLAVTLYKLAERRMREEAEKKEEKFDGIPPLVIAHPATRVATEACKTIQFHLSHIKIACTLKELPPGVTPMRREITTCSTVNWRCGNRSWMPVPCSDRRGWPWCRMTMSTVPCSGSSLRCDGRKCATGCVRCIGSVTTR